MVCSVRQEFVSRVVDRGMFGYAIESAVNHHASALVDTWNATPAQPHDEHPSGAVGQLDLERRTRPLGTVVQGCHRTGQGHLLARCARLDLEHRLVWMAPEMVLRGLAHQTLIA